jgi:hypothetical protein
VAADTDMRGGGLIISSLLFKNFKMFRFSAFSPKLALGAAAALAAISLSPGSAQAFVVTVGGVQYDVTTFTGTYTNNISKFALPPAPGVMPWWGSQSLALEFADAVGENLGRPDTQPYTGPYFGYSFDGALMPWEQVRVCTFSNEYGANCSGTYASAAISTYALATAYTPPAAPVPGPLPLFGAAAAFGFSRKFRKRIKLAPGALGSAMPRA